MKSWLSIAISIHSCINLDNYRYSTCECTLNSSLSSSYKFVSNFRYDILLHLDMSYSSNNVNNQSYDYEEQLTFMKKIIAVIVQHRQTSQLMTLIRE